MTDKTKEQKIKEIEKGCRESFIINFETFYCGTQYQESAKIPFILKLCPTCQAKLSILKEWEAEEKINEKQIAILAERIIIMDEETKRKVEELKKWIIENDNYAYRKSTDFIDKINKVFSPQEDGK